MNLGKKIVSVAAGIALVAGAGAIAATPATAAPKPKIKGTTTLSLPPALVETLGEAGITLNAIGGGKVTVDGSTGFANASFPITGPVVDGEVKHRGTLQIVNESLGVTLSIENPVVAYATDGSGTGEIGGVVNGLPVWTEPFATAINGTFREGLFVLKDVKIDIKPGKVRKSGKQFMRSDVVTLTAGLYYNDSQDSANLFNAALTQFPLGPAIFTPGMALGDASSKSTITVMCKTKKACQ
jgi:hypothetical protein